MDCASGVVFHQDVMLALPFSIMQDNTLKYTFGAVFFKNAFILLIMMLLQYQLSNVW